ncbi:MAG TPA: hypothetical protein VKF59_09950 [Candidatus Dormibacteraeota bacterium]|nr:hypothetical protein [Candidatus Dormibacteraeota bacterium]
MANPTEINVDFPDSDELQLRIVAGPCRLNVAPGGAAAATAWVSGTYDDPTGLLPLRVRGEGGRLTLMQSAHVTMPATVTRPPGLRLALGAGRPFGLTVEGGANDVVLNLGGLPITRLKIRHGAGRSEVDFPAPNPSEMEVLEVAAGGAATHLRNLANAGFARMVVAGGAGTYHLHFGGELRRDGAVRLTTGAASAELVLPAATAARVRSETVLAGLDVGDGFTTSQGELLTAAAVAGRLPVLRVSVSSTLGAVRLRSS